MVAAGFHFYIGWLALVAWLLVGETAPFAPSRHTSAPVSLVVMVGCLGQGGAWGRHRRKQCRLLCATHYRGNLNHESPAESLQLVEFIGFYFSGKKGIFINNFNMLGEIFAGLFAGDSIIPSKCVQY